jgi:hypothetical protein
LQGRSDIHPSGNLHTRGPHLAPSLQEWSTGSVIIYKTMGPNTGEMNASPEYPAHYDTDFLYEEFLDLQQGLLDASSI